MNLLIFVLSLIMILSAMTYARFESFMKSQLQSEQWRDIMLESQRDSYNQREKACPPPKKKPVKPREDADPSKKEDQPAKPQPQNPSTTGRISLSWFLNPELQVKSPAQYNLMKELAASLITQQWGNQPFFKRLVKDRPEFVSALLQDLTATATKANTEKKETVKNFDDLLLAPWSDVELKTAFGRMLQEGLVYDKKKQHDDGSPDITYESPLGFHSLRDFFTVKKDEKIRVWLAPRALLESIFPDPQVVQQVIGMRDSIYREVKNSKVEDKSGYTAKFKSEFSSKTPFDELLDWTVTTTDPRNR